MEFEGVDTNDNYAYRLALTDIAIGPVKNAWAKYTAVGGNFVSNYAIYKDGKILNDYKGAAAAEVGVTVGIPVGIPVDLTLGNTLWMGYPMEPEWNETTAEIVVEPLKDLKATVSGAYKVDLDDTDDAEEGKTMRIQGSATFRMMRWPEFQPTLITGQVVCQVDDKTR